MAIFLYAFISLITLHCTTSVASVTYYGNETDRQALLSFKNMIVTNLPSWNNFVHYCDWHGVTCGRRHRRVVALNLRNNELFGRISPSLGNLSFLKSLHLQENHFLGNIPQELGQLSRLQHLNLTRNVLQAEFPSNLTRCLALRAIDIRFNGLVGKIPESIGSLTNLNFLGFFSNNLHGVMPQSLGNISFLETLSLGENHLQGPIAESIGRLKNLEFFNIGVNNISGTVPSSLYNISSLTHFIIPSNKLTGSLPIDIGLTLPNLCFISVGDNQWFGSFPDSFSNASNIQALDVYDSNLDGPVPADLGTKMVDLRWLLLGYNSLGTKNEKGLSFLDSLTNCTKLEVLDIDENDFVGVLPGSITNLSTKLEHLYAGGNQFVGNIPDGISKYVNLSELALESNFVTGSIPLSIGNLQGLQLLDLRDNRLSGPIPTFIGNLTQLFQLNLEINNLTGSIPPSFQKLQGLQILDLSYNNLHGSVSKTFSPVSTLVSVRLAHNSFTGPLPSEIGSFTGVHDLNFSNNKFSGEIPRIIGNCLALEYLNLENNMLEGSIPASLGSLHGLVELDLSRNNLSGEIPMQLEKLSLLEYLNLSFNNLQGEVPSKGSFNSTTIMSIVGNRNLCGGIQELHLPACSTKRLKKHLSLGAIIAIASAVAGFPIVVSLFVWWKTKPKTASSQTFFGEDFLRVSYNDLLKATEGFSLSNLIGVGSFGSVYKGILHLNERPVAIKVFNLEQAGATKSFIAECEALTKIRHRNLIKIITACSSVNFQGESFKALVFEFMTNGSLDKWLHSCEDVLDPRQNLNIFRRQSIAIDVASALKYLHQDCETPIVHCDLKPSNVLLDEDMNAHVGDFGLSRFLALSFSSGSTEPSSSVAVRGSIGYVAPEYGMSREVSIQGDIYSFGILLLEMVTGKNPTDEMFTEGQDLHSYCKMALPEQILDIVDPCLLLDEEPNEAFRGRDRKYMITVKRECLFSLVKLGMACSAECPDHRMDAGSVLIELKRINKCFLKKRFVV